MTNTDQKRLNNIDLENLVDQDYTVLFKLFEVNNVDELNSKHVALVNKFTVVHEKMGLTSEDYAKKGVDILEKHHARTALTKGLDPIYDTLTDDPFSFTWECVVLHDECPFELLSGCLERFETGGGLAQYDLESEMDKCFIYGLALFTSGVGAGTIATPGFGTAVGGTIGFFGGTIYTLNCLTEIQGLADLKCEKLAQDYEKCCDG